MFKAVISTMLCIHLSSSIIASEFVLIAPAPKSEAEAKKLMREDPETARTQIDAETLLHQIMGIVVVDILHSRTTSPAIQLTHGSCYSPSVNVLREWLKSPLQEIFTSNELIAACAQHIPAGFDSERVKNWCIDLVRNWHTSRKRPLMPHEAMTHNILSTVFTKNPSMHTTHQGLALFTTPDTQREKCESIRKNIGSLCALYAARIAYKPHSLSEPTCTAELLQAGGDARKLYHELAIERYQAACNARALTYHPTYLPPVLQELTESFVYNAYHVMKNLHTVETTPRLNINYDWLVVGNENFSGITTTVCNNVITSHLYDLFSEHGTQQHIEKLIKKECQKKSNYTIASVEGSPSAYHLLLQLKNDKDIVLCCAPQSNTNINYSSQQLTPQDTYHSCNGAENVIAQSTHMKNNTTKFEMYNIAEKHITHASASGKWNIISSNDSGKIFVALGNKSAPYSPPYRQLLISNQHIRMFNLPHKATSPVLTVDHAGTRYALGSRNEQGKTTLLIGTTNISTESHSPILCKQLTGHTFQKITFSRDDNWLFIKASPYTTVKGTLSNPAYYMMDLRPTDPDMWNVTPCPLPTRRFTSNTPPMIAIDPYGEYIGGHMRSSPNTTPFQTTQVIPTHYHLITNLVPAMKGMSYPDRYSLYLLDEAVRHAPGPAHISPQQWKFIFKTLGLQTHLFFRPRLRLTTQDGTKLRGPLYCASTEPLRTETLVKRSLANFHAVFAASKIE